MGKASAFLLFSLYCSICTKKVVKTKAKENVIVCCKVYFFSSARLKVREFRNVWCLQFLPKKRVKTRHIVVKTNSFILFWKYSRLDNLVPKLTDLYHLWFWIWVINKVALTKQLYIKLGTGVLLTYVSKPKRAIMH